MDTLKNPFSPGAGTPPPQLAGREQLLENVAIALQRASLGRSSKSVLMVGLRGVGKTVLLDRMFNRAVSDGLCPLRIEAPEARSLPALLAPELRKALLKLSRTKAAGVLAKRALSGLAGFAKALKVKFNDIEVGFDFDPEAGLADNGDLELDLAALLEAAGEAAKAAKSALVLFIDELQYVEENQLAALISALHRCAQRQLPVCLVGAGLPQLRGRMGNAKSYAERLFDFPMLGPLNDVDARIAIEKPLNDLDVTISPAALDAIVQVTQGYPYFLQEWGKHVWDVAEHSPISVREVKTATTETIATLDESFFRVRFDRLTPTEKNYLRAMAALGAGPHRSGDIAERMKRVVSVLAPVRNQLINKGMIWSPSHGDTAFTVPLFDEFMIRIMPCEPDYEITSTKSQKRKLK
jgi:AAA ATPase domain